MKTFNMVIPILMHFWTFIRQQHGILQRQQRKTTTLTN